MRQPRLQRTLFPASVGKPSSTFNILDRTTSWWGHARPCPCPGALCEGWTGSPTVDLRGQLIYRGLSSDRAGRLRSIRTSKVSSKSIFLFCRKCAICDFPSETSATPPPVSECVAFRKKLRTYEMFAYVEIRQHPL